MKLVFQEIGEKKISKIVEVTTLPDITTVPDFIGTEIKPYMPKSGKFEVIPTDGLDSVLSSRYVVVHHDAGLYVSRKMGTVVVY